MFTLVVAKPPLMLAVSRSRLLGRFASASARFTRVEFTMPLLCWLVNAYQGWVRKPAR
jgi:hypothetical protein